MSAESNSEPGSPTPDQVETALQAFWRGSHAELDRLVGEDGDGGPSIGVLLAALVQWLTERQPIGH